MRCIVIYLNDSITHHKCAGVDTKDYFQRPLQGGLYFYRLNEAKQKYQNLSQLFSRSLIIHLVVSVNLRSDTTSTTFCFLVEKHPAICSKRRGTQYSRRDYANAV